MNDLFAIAMPVACLAWIVTKEEICREIRQAAAFIKARRPCWISAKLDYLVGCYFCTSVWISAGLLALVPSVRLPGAGWVAYGLTVFAAVFVANVYLSLFNLLRILLRASAAIADAVERAANASRDRKGQTA